MARFITLVVLLPLLLTCADANGKKDDGKKNKKCPNYNNLANYDDPKELARIQDQVMDDLWDNEYPVLTDLGEDLQDVLYDMTESRVPFWRRYALAVTEWIWAYFPDIDRNLNLCSYAEMINKTLIFVNENNCKSILEAIDSSTKAFTEAGFRLTENGIRNSGCDSKNISLSKPATTKCYKDGFAYDIEKMWDVVGWEYPHALRSVVMKLYKSSNKKDKIMALLATAVLSKYLAILENEYEPDTLYKIFVMLTPGKLPKNCCEKFVKDALDLSAYIQKNNVGMFELARKSTNCGCHSHE